MVELLWGQRLGHCETFHQQKLSVDRERTRFVFYFSHQQASQDDQDETFSGRLACDYVKGVSYLATQTP